MARITLILALLAGMCNAETANDSKTFTIITESTAEAFVNNSTKALVIFVPDSIALFERIAHKFAEKLPEVKIALYKSNGSGDEFINRLAIPPSLHAGLFVEGEYVPYKHEFDISGIIAWVKRLSGSAIGYVNSLKEICNGPTIESVTLVLPKNDTKITESFEEVAKTMKRMELIKFYVFIEPSFTSSLVYCDCRNKPFTTNVTVSYSCDIAEFRFKIGQLLVNPPKITELTPQHLRRILTYNVPTLIAFATPSHLLAILTILEKLHTSYATLPMFYHSNATFKEVYDICMVDPDTFPQIRILHPTAHSFYKYTYNGTMLSLEGIKSFVNDWTKGELKPFYKSLPTNSENDSFSLTFKTYDSAVKSSENDILILYVTTFCEHCKKYEVILQKLHNQFSSCNGLLIRRIDIDEFKINANVYTFPTLLLHRRIDRQDPLEYDGDPSEDQITKFIRANSNFNCRTMNATRTYIWHS